MSEKSRVFVSGPDGRQQGIQGDLDYLPKAKPEEVSGVIQGSANPFFDYFIFEDEEGVYLFKSEADQFNLEGTPVASLNVTIPPTKAKVHKITDHPGKEKISKVEIKIVRPEEWEEPLPHENFLKSNVEPFLNRELAGKTVSLGDIRKALEKIGPALARLSYEMEPRPVLQADGNYNLELILRSAPVAIDIGEIPVELQKEAKALLQKEMEELLEKHPFIRNAHLVDVDTEKKLPRKPVPNRFDSILAWRTPKNAPHTQESVLWQIIGELTGEIPELIVPLTPGEPMPIPKQAVAHFVQWLAVKLAQRPGKYEINLEPGRRPGEYRLKFKQTPFYDVSIPPKLMEVLKAKTGIDVSEEAKLLEGGTKEWSAGRFKGLLNRIQKKYREAGFQLLTEHPQILAPYDKDTVWLQLNLFRPLIHREHLELTGEDLGLPEMPSKEEMATALFGGQKTASMEEFLEGFQKLKKMLAQKDFLYAGSYPDSPASGLPQVAIEGENKMQLRVVMARCGTLTIEAKEIPEDSRAALEEALAWQEGAVMRPGEFEKKLMRTLHRLSLVLEGNIDYVYRDAAHLNIRLKIEKPKGVIGGGVSSGSAAGGPALVGNVNAPHKIPGTSEADFLVEAGLNQQTLRVGAKSLPLSKGGMRVQSNLSLSRFSDDATGRGYDRVAGDVALLVPLGNEGLASPWHLIVPLRADYIHKEGFADSGSFFAGTGAGLSYVNGGLLSSRDLLSAKVRQEVDRDLSGELWDTTTRAELMYTLPVAPLESALELRGDFYHRRLLSGSQLPPVRLLNPEVPPLDFAQGMGRLPQDTNATASLLLRRQLGPFSLAAGASVSDAHEITDFASAGGAYRQRAAVGLAVTIPLVGGQIYVGWPVMEDGNWHTPDPHPVVGMTIRKTIPLD